MASPTIRTVASYNTHIEYSVDFFGDEFIVTVTWDSSVISRWIRNVLFNNRFSSHPLVVGVGVQWTPFSYYSDPRPNNYYADPPPIRYYSDNPADILQLCVGNRCLIIQLGYCDQVPNNLRSFLADPETTFVGVWNGQDAGKLARCCHQLEIGELLDIRRYVTDSWGRSMRRSSFEEIVEECMGYQGVMLDPEISMSDWTAYDLDLDQILQASLDAYVCHQLGVWTRLWEV
ncbi:putative ribonuclease H-like superfamily [Arabidopsis thaliana]